MNSVVYKPELPKEDTGDRTIKLPVTVRTRNGPQESQDDNQGGCGIDESESDWGD